MQEKCRSGRCRSRQPALLCAALLAQGGRLPVRPVGAQGPEGSVALTSWPPPEQVLWKDAEGKGGSSFLKLPLSEDADLQMRWHLGRRLGLRPCGFLRDALRCGRHRCSRRASLALRQRGVILKWRLRRLCMRRVAASDSRCTRCRPFPPRRPLRKPFGDYSPAPCVPYDVGTRGRRPANDTPRKTRTCSRWRLGHESHTQNTQRALQCCSRFSWAGGAVRGAIGDALGCQAAQRQIMQNLQGAPNPQEVIFHCELGNT